ncbi:uncharacterized protein LOC135210471 [Macrobrachium nipponense]|uniref:uncharacterized protein LOC135210471 n=1 Tax=Macrobrachium nipponense TaxID=159736 RepID=UPI0030C897E3
MAVFLTGSGLIVQAVQPGTITSRRPGHSPLVRRAEASPDLLDKWTRATASRTGTANEASSSNKNWNTERWQHEWSKQESADVMERRRVGILSVQETRWKGNKAKDIGNGYKLLYSGADETGRSGVGIVITKEMKENIVGIERKSERIMKARLCCGGHILNVVSAYAPQTGCSEEVKNKFWRDMDEVMTSTEIEERQHKLVVSDLLLRRVGMGKEVVQLKIKWWQLEEQEIRERFKEAVLRVFRLAEDV